MFNNFMKGWWGNFINVLRLHNLILSCLLIHSITNIYKNHIPNKIHFIMLDSKYVSV